MADTLLESERAALESDSLARAELAANAERRRREPIAGPLDVVALILIVVMIWGPLAAGAFRS